MAIRREQKPQDAKHGVEAIGLNVIITGLALALAFIAAQNPFF